MSTAVPVWSKILKLMTWTSSSGPLSGGATMTARNVGDWKGANFAAISMAWRAYRANPTTSPASRWPPSAVEHAAMAARATVRLFGVPLARPLQ